MSATLNFNLIKYNSWKGNMFYQASSFLKKNTKNEINVKLIMKPLPLNIYRREIRTGENEKCNERISMKIDEINRPGSAIQNGESQTGLVNFITNNITECTSTNSESCIHMPDMDARRRVRSAGMIRRKYNENRNNDTYCTSSSQYLTSRNRTFSQNQYNFIRQGNSNVKPGSALSKSNLYSPNGISHCIQPYISIINQNNVFRYRWINNIEYEVTIPNGQYDIYQLNNIFQNKMTYNTHYFINNDSGSNDYLLTMAYDDLNKVVFLNTTSSEIYLQNISDSTYSIAQITLDDWGNVTDPSNVAFIIQNNGFQNIVGFSTGTYSAVTQSSNITPNIKQNYVTMNYKPNNPQFGQQGAVSSSTLVSRKRYDTITDVGAKMKAPYGSATANALAYGVTDHQYTIKDKIGYPVKKTPVISKYSGEIKCVNTSCK